MSAKIRFSDLWTYAHDADQAGVRRPLRDLPESGEHIHGRLEIVVSGKPLRHLGFFGDDDVCFNTWVAELAQILARLAECEVASYIFDEGEQGQPAFEFKRDGEVSYVSIVDSELSGAHGDPSYQLVSCLWEEFSNEICSFLDDFRAELFRAAPRVAQDWWAHTLSPG